MDVLYSTANDPQRQMIPRPQMIPKMDRKWSSTASDPKVDRKWSREKLREWIGSYGTDYKKRTDYKKEPFPPAFYRKRQGGRPISGQFVKGEKKKKME